MTSVMSGLPGISDEEMMKLRATTRSFTIRILRHGPRYDMPGAEAIIREHGRRNLALRAAGVLAIACPVRDGSEIAGVGIFDADPDEVERIMAGDPAVQAGVLTFEVHPSRSIPGDCLPTPAAGGSAPT